MPALHHYITPMSHKLRVKYNYNKWITTCIQTYLKFSSGNKIFNSSDNFDGRFMLISQPKISSEPFQVTLITKYEVLRSIYARIICKPNKVIAELILTLVYSLAFLNVFNGQLAVFRESCYGITYFKLVGLLKKNYSLDSIE